MSFRITNSFFEGKSLPLTEPSISDSSENCITVIVGKNGIGKSRFLGSIVNAMNSCFYDGRLTKVRSYRTQRVKALDDFHLQLESDGIDSSLSVRMGHSDYDGEITGLPEKIIAVSTSQHDKFPLARLSREDDGSGRYFYLGEKMSRASLIQGPTTILDRVTGSLFRNVGASKKDNNKLKDVFNFLGYRPSVTVVYRFEMSINKIIDEIRNISDSQSSDRKYFSTRIRDIQKRIELTDSMSEVLEAIDYLGRHDSKRREIIFDMNFENATIETGSIELFTHTHLLRKIGLMRLEDVILYPLDMNLEEFSIREASSGEQCVISTILGIAAEIEDNSLICIDEPEISLHPEWQEKYIDLLVKTFSSYRGCHFIIATHSPQIVSRIRGENCFILKMEAGELIPASEHYKKSADYQLAVILEAPGYSNEFLARECLSLITKISKSNIDEISDIKIRANKLIEIRPLIEDSDPIANLIDGLKMAIEDRF